jgi:hypothetical protein
LIVSFETKGLRDLCEDMNIARKELGNSIALNLQTRLSELFAASSLEDLIVGNLQKIENEAKFKIDLYNNCILIFVPINKKNNLIKEDLELIDRIKLIEIKFTENNG